MSSIWISSKLLRLLIEKLRGEEELVFMFNLTDQLNIHHLAIEEVFELTGIKITMTDLVQIVKPVHIITIHHPPTGDF